MNEVKGKFQIKVAIEKALEDVKSLKELSLVSLTRIIKHYGPVGMKQVREALEGPEGMDIGYLPAVRGHLVLDVLESSICQYMTEVVIDRLREETKIEGAEDKKRKTKGEK